MIPGMDANQYVFLHGMRRTRTVLASWEGDPWPVIRTWLLGAVLIALGLLAAVTVAASLITPDYGFHYGPMVPGGPSPERVLGVLGRNSLVLALHAAACVAGFISGAALPLSTERRTGLSRLVHEKAIFAPIWLLAFLNGVGPRVGESSFGRIAGFPYTAPFEDITIKGA